MGVAAITAMTFGPASVSADHFDPNSSKVCDLSPGGQVVCTLTIGIMDDGGPGVGPSEIITVDLGAGTTGATFESATVTGGSCVDGATVTVVSDTLLNVDPQAAGSVDDCTIIVEEVLSATSSGNICQTLNSPSNAPVETVCADIVAPPSSAAQCKNGGWEAYGIFKNQGDCVAFVETQGKNEPGQNIP